jgi:AcrR family transcriptional regulator
MSRERSRPTREETASRIIAAAVDVFEETGITGASIEDIARAAGLTRGAFYSSFSDKEELVVALIEQQWRDSIQRNQLLALRYRDPVEFLRAMTSDEERTTETYRWSSLLNFELMLYVIRVPKHRSKVSLMLQEMRTVTGTIVAETMRHAGVTRDIDVEQAGAMLVALEDGFDLHRLIDPDQTPPTAYFTALAELQALVLEAPRATPKPTRRPKPSSAVRTVTQRSSGT